MPGYQEDIKKLARLCRKCEGRCCYAGKEISGINISKLELKRLQKILDFEVGKSVSPHGSMNKIVILPNKPCPFIGKIKGKHAGHGCILKGKIRPLGCRLFPLTFVMEKNKPKFYLSGFCPSARKAAVLKSWIARTVKDAEQELKTWTKTEKLCRSHWHRSHGKLRDIPK